MESATTLYDSFNARYLDFNEVADLFIVNDQYKELIKNNHSLLMGPRGSGKTTLLKMLTIPAQEYWKNKNQAEKESIQPPFFAVYIPTDVHWKKQIDDFEAEFKGHKNYQSVITKLLVTTNILASLCDTYIQLLEFKPASADDLAKEAELSVKLIEDWKLSRPVATNLRSVKHALLARLREINIHIKKVRILKIPENQINYPEYFFDEYIDLISLGCDAFESIFKSDEVFKSINFKWAFCFDELEIAPKWLQNELLSILRSLTNQKLLFKLTMVPLVMLEDYKSITTIVDAREDQDFKVVRTWTYSQTSIKNWEAFSRRLIQDKFRRKYNNKINPLSLFGSSKLDRNITDTFKSEDGFINKSGYSKGSGMWFLFKELAAIDSSFRDFLKDKEITPSNPIPANPSQHDSIFRKTKPIVLHRFQFKSPIIGKLRSRKNPSLYYGIPSIYEICDGNPRALIGLVDEFIEKITFESNGSVIPIDINRQSKIISDTSEKYLSLLVNHPDSNIKYYNKYINLGSVLQRIGKYFEDKLISDSFSMDPNNCFEVDKDTPYEIVELLKVAMHLGAIIYLNPDEAVSKKGIVGKKFRLSYLLFPNFRLPLVDYKDVKLSSILKKGTDKIDQLLLFTAE